MKISRSIVVPIVSLAITLMASSAWAVIFNKNNNGAACVAANLTQALELSWDHARVWNSGTRDLWVLCPVETATDYANATLTEYLYPMDAWIYGWFGSSATGSAAIVCTAREMSPTGTTTVAAASVTVNIAKSGVTLPQSQVEVADLSTFTSMDSVAGPYPVTFACKLPPGTGINAIRYSANIIAP